MQKVNKEQEITLLYQLIEKHYGSGVLMQFEDLTETGNEQLLNRIETMTTYKSYAEAKIDNPREDIYESMSGDFAGADHVSLVVMCGTGEGWNKCNPADHCMTVEKFLADGHKFVEGDLYLEAYGEVRETCSTDSYIVDLKAPGYCSRYILRAAALETKEPKRTKESYEKVEYSHAWEIIKLYEDGVELFKTDSDKLQIKRINSIALRAQSGYSFYRCIETPIEWWEDAAEFINQHGFAGFANGNLEAQVSMTRDQWCDFARILLEQGE